MIQTGVKLSRQRRSSERNGNDIKANLKANTSVETFILCILYKILSLCNVTKWLKFRSLSGLVSVHMVTSFGAALSSAEARCSPSHHTLISLDTGNSFGKFKDRLELGLEQAGY